MPTLHNFGVPTGDLVFNRGGIMMPKVKNRFRVYVANFGIPGSEIVFTQQVMTAARPNVSFSPIEVHSYNSIAYYGGKATWETVEVTLRDDVTNAVSRLVSSQLQRQMNFFEETVPLTSGDYKFDMAVETLDGGGVAPDDAVVLEQWVYEGCFLSTANYESFDYASADAMTISLTVRFDNATQSGGLMTNPPLINLSTSMV